MKNQLAAIFSQIDKAAGTVEKIAEGVLSAIKSRNANTLDQFNDMVTKAYATNGWSQKTGRPLPGAKEKPAPQAVKLYVSTVRRAYRMGLKVTTYQTMEAIRVDIRKAAQELRPTAPTPAPELVGIQVQQEQQLTGALWHDAVVLYEHLPDEQRAMFEAQVRRLLTKYRKDAPAELLRAS